MIDYIYLVLFNLARFFIFLLPSFTYRSLANFLGYLAYIFDKKHRRIAKVNLDLCFKDSKSDKEKKEIIKRTFQNYSYYAIDFLDNQNASKERILKKIRWKNKEVLDAALKRGRNIFIQTAHYGNWEIFSLAFGIDYGNTNIVGRALDSAVMNKILSNNREQFGINLIDKENALREILKAFKKNEMVGILVDQNTSEKEGIEIEFFGNRAMHTPAASVIANKTNALILPSFLYTAEDGKNEFVILDVIDPLDIKDEENKIKILTQAQASATQKMIEFKPDEYFWFHRRFKRFYKELYK